MPRQWESSKPDGQGRTVSGYFLKWEPVFAAGAVHSVFASSFNVEIGGRLLHVGSPPHPLSCLGINIPQERSPLFFGELKRGDRAVLKHHSLLLYTEAQVVTIEYGDYTPKDMSVIPAAAERRSGLKRALCEMDLIKSIGIPWDTRLEKALAALAQRDTREENLKGAIRFLLGRGKGLTPSGDDILMGYGAGCILFQTANPFLNTLSAVLDRQTTDVSLAYLRAMLDGCVNEDYLELFRAVRAGETGRYGALLAKIRQNGHTSGSDSLLGLLTAVWMQT